MADLHIRNFEAIAFDFDGVLADSVRSHTEARMAAYIAMLDKTGDNRFLVPPDIHAEAQRHGSTPLSINAWVLHQVGVIPDPLEIDHPVVQAVVEQKNKAFRIVARHGHEMIPGARRLLQRTVKQLPGNLGIVTTAHDWEVLPFLTRHRLVTYVPRPRIVMHDDLSDPTHVKPHPEAYQLSLERLGVREPSRLLAIEDTPPGIEAAKQAGLIVVGLATTRQAEELAAGTGYQRPDAVAEDMQHLSVLLGV